MFFVWDTVRRSDICTEGAPGNSWYTARPIRPSSTLTNWINLNCSNPSQLIIDLINWGAINRRKRNIFSSAELSFEASLDRFSRLSQNISKISSGFFRNFSLKLFEVTVQFFVGSSKNYVKNFTIFPLICFLKSLYKVFPILFQNFPHFSAIFPSFTEMTSG